jgi:hypothetical protein
MLIIEEVDQLMPGRENGTLIDRSLVRDLAFVDVRRRCHQQRASDVI